MGRSVLTLDQIWSATSTFSIKWSHGIESNKAHRILHYLLCRLYDQGRGQLVNTRLTLAQTTLSKKLGISRQWVGELVGRLEREGWVEHFSPKLADGMNGSSLWRAGRQLKRLIIMLSKSKSRKNPAQKPAKSAWHFSPLKRERGILSILEKESTLPTLHLLEKIPLLGQWLIRGKEKERGQDNSSSSPNHEMRLGVCSLDA